MTLCVDGLVVRPIDDLSFGKVDVTDRKFPPVVIKRKRLFATRFFIRHSRCFAHPHLQPDSSSQLKKMRRNAPHESWVRRDFAATRVARCAPPLRLLLFSFSSARAASTALPFRKTMTDKPRTSTRAGKIRAPMRHAMDRRRLATETTTALTMISTTASTHQTRYSTMKTAIRSATFATTPTPSERRADRRLRGNP